MANASNKYQYHQDGTLPKNGEILVFGSNDAGIHGAGAAKVALQFGAKMGIGHGLVGKTYAIATKDRSIVTLPFEQVAKNVATFIEFAVSTPELTYFVTRVGCVLAGFSNAKIAPLFAHAPINCNFPEEWKQYLE